MIIAAGDPVGQMIFVRNDSPKLVYTEEPRIKTARGSTGGIVTQVSLPPPMYTSVLKWD